MRSRACNNKGLIFVVSGPSGSGKTTLLKSLLKTKGLKNKLIKSISFTTRPRRSGERNGKDYFFISERQFREKLKAQKILEWTKYLGYYYATPKDFIKRQYSRCRYIILCLDLKGALKIKRLYPGQTVSIFVLPPSLKVLRERITMRCNKTHKEEIRQRLKLAREELVNRYRYDYYLVNKDLAHTVSGLRKIIIKEIDTFGDKPQCKSIGESEPSRRERGFRSQYQHSSIPKIKYSKQTPMPACRQAGLPSGYTNVLINKNWQGG